ncbi:intramembrane metalloprotease PrsW [Cerasibacillus terrae]|uniref:Protease PrsW n=1 Tax=Cerasibacillus terrae TaxID=2498845 RepID=A0A5C8P414_9BACI|nr:glutamic-type intramembrane protease PrsW [Cerasibacillus terrae]TXL67873.1 intramembrane metalloprotease PrsW [Cerasibacillus terrae]
MIAILSAAIAPAIALMAYFYLRDYYTEPLTLIIRTFIFGALLVFPLMFVQYTFKTELFLGSFVHAFIISGLTEEFFKWFVFMYVVYQHTEFDTHYDGIIYAVAISLGFATVENILYLLSNGIEYALTRAIFPVSSHALFGVMMGYHFGMAKIIQKRQKWNIFLALLLPFILHGTYNFILKTSENWLLVLIPFMICLWGIGIYRIKLASRHPIS